MIDIREGGLSSRTSVSRSGIYSIWELPTICCGYWARDYNSAVSDAVLKHKNFITIALFFQLPQKLNLQNFDYT